MKHHFGYIIAFVLGLLLLTGCSRGYDKEECTRLADIVATTGQLSQDDYASMINQSGHILSFLIDRTNFATDGLDAAGRADARAALRRDDEYMEKFDFMFTFNSVLYRAHLAGVLSPENAAAYEALDSRSERFARLWSTL